ncbi:MAG: SIS domain-containing protein [Burkholderiales bacterium]|nr:SIS domain-containing protein [Burkholderiales bacterium]
MLKEASSSADFVAEQLKHEGDRYAELGAHLRAKPPTSVVTVARGSSDHAANYAAYLIMARVGRIVASLPMSLVTLNDAASPLAQSAEWTMPLHAGPELSVAATKSFITSLVAGARLAGHWQNDAEFLAAIEQLPESLHAATKIDWSPAIEVLQPASRIMVVGRGISFPVALESALKFKETSVIQAEAFSGAEIKHGPMALIHDGYPLLIFATRGPAQAGLITLAEEMRGRGANVLLAAPEDVKERNLTLPVAATPDLDPVVAIQAFYMMAANLSIARGLDPDKPRHLSKVTKTN